MNFVKYSSFATHISKTHIVFCLFLAILLSIYLVGCSDKVLLPSAGQLAEFENAGPVRPSVDIDRLVRAKIGGGPYRVVPGEVLELTMPTILQVVTAEDPEISGKMAPYVCRISDAGTITLPVVGEIEVEGKTLSEIESTVIDAYHPEYTVTRPSVFAQVLEYETAKVSITGAVNKPGIYSLRSDQMSLVALLMEAGSIIDEGAALIRIIHHDQVVSNNEETAIETVGEPSERSSGLNATMLAKPATRYPASNGTDIQLAFKQSSPSSTIGMLTVVRDETILLAERIDIANEVDRLFLLERLARKMPLASITDEAKKLRALAELLKRASGKYNSESTIANRNINSNVELYTSYLRQNSTADETLGKELLEIPNLDKKPKSGKITEPSKLKKTESIVLPVRGLNILFADVVLRDGDSVIVERFREPLITVVGLVNRPGNFPYPPDVKYNLMQALGFAGGLLLSAEPRYATIYRLRADGTTVSAAFNIVNLAKNADPTDALSVPLKPYDVVAVEHTPRTRAKVWWDKVFRMYITTYIRLEDIIGED